MKKVLAVLISIGVIGVNNAYALFDSRYWGVRPLGMGGAFTAVADDANAPMYNVAGTATLEKPEVTVTSAKLFTGLDGVDMSTNYVGMVYPISEKFGSVSAAWSLFGDTGLRREDTASIGYARTLNDLKIWDEMDLSAGIALKYVRQEVNFGHHSSGGGKDSQDAVTIDIGILAHLPYGISAGFSSKYMTRPDVGFFSEDKVPAMNVIGLAYYSEKLPVIKIPKFTLAADYEIRSNDEDMLKIGAESKVINGSLSLRLGGWREQINFGAGYEVKLGEWGLMIDYAFGLPLEIQESTGSHFLSLTFRLP
ncbi:MAG: type IX secretion system membrane protein PorP/SprF [Endomicrobia bacterium]|nr:type IX secretion system membrane protein PorP/SprF [Endomicrobiia bacterium]